MDLVQSVHRSLLDGYTTAEVAEELGIHPVALRVRWTRLRQRLSEAGVLLDLVEVNQLRK